VPVRRVGVVAVIVALLTGIAGPVWAEPSPASPADAGASPVPGDAVCEINDSRAVGLSGLVATDTGYAAVNHSQDGSAAMRIFFFDHSCQLTRSIVYPSPGAHDPQDLAVAPDGTLWIADTGDTTTAGGNRRQSIALWTLAPGAATPVAHRLTYPDGPHDAAALVFDGAGTPLIVTKDPSGTAGIYTPTGPLLASTTSVATLQKVGTFRPRRTGTPNVLGTVGQLVVTGGANSPDGRRVVLRTYTDAYEWDVPDGDVMNAITTGTPRITPLPNEPRGESIAYTRDGASLLTLSDNNGPTRLLRYQPVKPSPSARPAPNRTATTAGHKRGWFKRLSLDQVLYLVGVVGVLGLVMIAVGALGIRGSRRARRTAAAATAAPGVVGGRTSVGALARHPIDDSEPVRVTEPASVAEADPERTPHPTCPDPHRPE
jgi:hypothetical protein